jgi:hypothetical protein
MADTADLKTAVLVFAGLLIPVKVLGCEPIKNFFRLIEEQSTKSASTTYA